MSFAKVRGHAEALGALQRRLAEPGVPHAFLMTGPAGIGKTTIARLISRALNADPLEIDAATYSGVEAMRHVVDLGMVLAPGSARRMLIVDECHRLSDNAWDAALKTVEEPPPHLFWGLCTTAPAKIPETIISRSYHIRLDRLPDAQIEELLLDIVVAEQWDGIVQPDVFRLVAQEAGGSPRQALSLLQACYDAPDVAEARRIIRLQSSAEPLRQVLSMLVAGQGGWEAVQPLLAQLGDEDFSEGAVIGACRYVITALSHEPNPETARRLWELLAALTYPVRTFDSRSLFFAAVGRMLWSRI